MADAILLPGLTSTDTIFSIREQCGHSLKSALTHMWIYDMRDEPLMPSNGHFVRVIQEYAGLGGDVEHLRQEIEAQTCRSNDNGYVGVPLIEYRLSIVV